MSTKIDINYIAQMAGVSRSTVSRVLTKKTNVKASTKAKVEQVMQELNYRPNSMARGLVMGRQNLIGLIVTDIRNPFYTELIWTISNAIRKKGYMMTLYNSGEANRENDQFLWGLLDYGFSGLIFADARNEESFLSFLENASCPVVLVNRNIEFKNPFDTISIDNFKGGYLATKHLIELGHKRIAMLKGPAFSATSQGRYEGFLYALKEAGIPVNNDYVYSGILNMESGRTFAKNVILNSKHPPTAVFVGGDLMSYGVMDECLANGVMIPDDLSIIGFDDIPFSGTSMINLTTISHPYTQMGELVAEKIIKRIENSSAPIEQVSLLPSLILRGSTASPKEP